MDCEMEMSGYFVVGGGSQFRDRMAGEQGRRKKVGRVYTMQERGGFQSFIRYPFTCFEYKPEVSTYVGNATYLTQPIEANDNAK